MPVSGSTGLPIAPRNTHWHGGDARARVVDFYTKNGNTNWSQVKRAFMWIDPGKEEQKTGYSLGFADIIDGKLQIVDRGVFAVAGGHGVTRIQGPSSSERNQIKRKVNTLYRRLKAKFPNDEFSFDPPFPEVKDMEDNEEIKQETPVEAVPDLWEEVKRKFFFNNGSATSFSDLTAMEAVREAVQKVFKTVYAFEELASNIARQSENPGDLVSGLQSLTKEMVSIFENMAFEETTDEKSEGSQNDNGLTTFINGSDTGEDWEVKQSGSTALLKNEKGDQFFYGRFTNNIWDKDGEVLISKAHQEFVDYLDDHPDEAPELWDWHEEDTRKTHQAIWWDYSDGFLHAIWPVTETEAKGIEAFSEEFEPGMSHGFKVLERKSEDPRQIAKYRTGEASILPREFAANEWTSFTLLETEEEKMFTPEKQRALELLSLGKYKKPLGKSSEEDAESLDQAGAQRKQHNKGTGEEMTDDQEKQEEVVETPEVPVETPAPVPAGVEATIQALQESTVEGFNLIMGQLKELIPQVQANSAALEGIKEKKGESPSVAAWVAAQKAGTAIGSVDDTDGIKGGPGSGKKKPVVDKDPLFGTGPEEEPFEINGHLLSSL